MKKIILIALLFGNGFYGYSQLNKEQTAIRQVFFDFLKFYKTHQKAFNAFDLYKGVGKDNNPPYKIQWKEVEKYFAYLRKNVPYVGEAYIEAERKRFKESEKDFITYKTEEIPSGFDYDRWAGGQEDIEYTYESYTSKKNIYQVIIKGNKATLRISGELMEGELEKDRYWSFVPFVKEKGKWKMAENVYPED